MDSPAAVENLQQQPRNRTGRLFPIIPLIIPSILPAAVGSIGPAAAVGLGLGVGVGTSLALDEVIKAAGKPESKPKEEEEGSG